MKAAQIDDYGDVSTIEVRDIEKPTTGANQVLVEVHASSLNPFDQAVLAGYAQAMAPLTFPATLGLDFAGEVVEIGADVTGFTVGDRVYGTANAMFGGSGAFAQYVAANAGSVAVAPSNLTGAEAASLPTAGISAWQSIVKELNVQDGQNVFINGGSGGVGSIAVQIAKHLGAHVATTTSTSNVDFVKSLDADEVIDYTSEKFVDHVHDFDAALNTARSDDANDVLQVVKEGGIVASLTGPLDAAKAEERKITNIGVMANISTESLTALRELVEQGAVHPVVDRSFALDDIQGAYTALASESIKGKIVIDIQ